MERAHVIFGVTPITALLTGGALLFSATAWAADCKFPTPGNVDVRIDRLDGQIVLDNERSRDSLRRMQSQSGRANAFGSAWTPVGLTLTELTYKVQLKLEAMPQSSGRYCARLTHVNAALGYDKLKVYIARKFRPGSCAYSSIHDHEMTHVAVFRQALDDYFPRLQRSLERAANQLQPVLATSPDQAAIYLRKRLNATVKSLFLDMNRVLDRNNAQLDTPERYRLEQARCKDW